MKKLLLILSILLSANAIEIKQMTIDFGEKRVLLTKEYIKNSYGLEVEDINIVPKIIVIHHTATDDLKESYDRFKPELL